MKRTGAKYEPPKLVTNRQSIVALAVRAVQWRLPFVSNESAYTRASQAAPLGRH